MKEEYNQLIKNGTWILVERPLNRKVMKCKWVFRTKRNQDGQIEKYKSRLCLKGYLQLYGLDYTDTFAPVVKITSIRLIMVLSVYLKLQMYQLDFDTTFLNVTLKETIFMEQPKKI